MVSITMALAIVGALLYLAYRYLTRVYDYWREKNIPGPTPSFPLGNMSEVAKRQKSFAQVITSFYNDYPQENFVGIYQGRSPMLIIKDIDDIKQVLIKDFANFRNRGLSIAESPLSQNLFNAEDETWRLLRQKMTPIFTSGKLKNMFHLMTECLDDFNQYLDRIVQTEAEPEIRELMAKFTLEMFGSCVLGINMRTLNDESNLFREIGTKIFKPRLKTSLSRSFNSIFPGLIKKLNIKLHDQEIVDFFMNLTRDLVREREGKPKVRKDFMDLLLELKEQGHITGSGFGGNKEYDLEITEQLMAAQALVFYAAGFETSSGTMAFLLHELAFNQDIQEKVYEEVRRVTDRHNGKVTYDAIQEMAYLDMVFSETLRIYPIGGVLIRESASAFNFPGTKVTIDEGVKILIPVDAIHKDPKYFENPDKFDPERFSPENKSKITQCTYMPFGEGPRNCIGLRFAKVQSMVGVASLLQKYRVVPSARTKFTLTFNPRATTLESSDGIWMKIQRR